jgi:hypothetical protein
MGKFIDKWKLSSHDWLPSYSHNASAKRGADPFPCILEQLLHKKLHIQGLHYQKNQVRSWCCCMLERGVSENDLHILILPFLKLVRLGVGLPHFQTHQIKIQHLKLLQYPNIPSKILSTVYIYISLKSLLNVAFYVPPLLDPQKNQANSKPQQVSCHLLHLQFHLRQHFSSCATLDMGSWISAEGSIYCSPK